MTPKYLYHASLYNDLDIITPQSKTLPIGFDKGKVVFATDNFAFSTQFLVPHDDTWALGGTFNHIIYFVISDKNRFTKSDKGGTIYLLPSDSFDLFNRREWISGVPVKPKDTVKYSSGLMAMLSQGVQVYFVDKKVFDTVRNSVGRGLSLLNSLTSENEKLGMKVERFDLYKGSKEKTG